MRAAAWAGLLGLTLVTLAVWQYWRVSIEALDAAVLSEAHSLANQITVADDVLDIAVPIELRARLDNEQSYYAIFDARGERLDRIGVEPARRRPAAARPHAGGLSRGHRARHPGRDGGRRAIHAADCHGRPSARRQPARRKRRRHRPRLAADRLAAPPAWPVSRADRPDRAGIGGWARLRVSTPVVSTKSSSAWRAH